VAATFAWILAALISRVEPGAKKNVGAIAKFAYLLCTQSLNIAAALLKERPKNHRRKVKSAGKTLVVHRWKVVQLLRWLSTAKRT